MLKRRCWNDIKNEGPWPQNQPCCLLEMRIVRLEPLLKAATIAVGSLLFLMPPTGIEWQWKMVYSHDVKLHWINADISINLVLRMYGRDLLLGGYIVRRAAAMWCLPRLRVKSNICMHETRGPLIRRNATAAERRTHLSTHLCSFEVSMNKRRWWYLS